MSPIQDLKPFCELDFTIDTLRGLEQKTKNFLLVMESVFREICSYATDNMTILEERSGKANKVLVHLYGITFLLRFRPRLVIKK